MQSAPIDFAALAVSRPSAQIMKLMRQRIEHYLAARSDPSLYQSVRNMSQFVSDDYGNRFLIELIQNAHDAHDPARTDGEIAISFDADEGEHGCLYVANRGAGFTWDNLKAITSIALSSKPVNAGIGNKGLGFRSVLQICAWPEIYSVDGVAAQGHFDGYCFRFATEADLSNALGEDASNASAEMALNMPCWHVPVSAEPGTAGLVARFASEGFATVVRLPLKSGDAATVVLAEIDRLLAVQTPLHLFLSRIACISIERQPGQQSRLERKVLQKWQPSLAGWKVTNPIDISRVRVGADEYVLADWDVDEPLFRKHLDASLAKSEVPDTWRNWEGPARVSVAVPLGRALDNGTLYCFLPLGEEGKAPFAGYINANFYTKMDRRTVSDAIGLNGFFLQMAAWLSCRMVDFLVEKSWQASPEAVVSLLCWDAAYLPAIKNGFGDEGRGILKRPMLPVRGPADTIAWAPAESTYSWVAPADACLSSKHVAEVASAQVLLDSLSPMQRTALDRLYQPLVGSASPFQPTPKTIAEWIEKIARQMHADAAPPERWAMLYDECARLLADRPEALFGKQFLLNVSGELISSEPPASGKRGKKAADVYFPPVMAVDADTDDAESKHSLPLERLPATLRKGFALLSRDVPWLKEDGGYRPGRAFLLSAKLAREYDTRDVIRTLAAVTRSDVAERTREQALEWAFRLWNSGRSLSEKETRAAMIFVPTAGTGWMSPEVAMFGAGWSVPNGKRLQALLQHAGEASPDLGAVRGHLLARSADWPIRHGDEADWIRFLSAAGVADCLRPVGGELVAAELSGQPAALAWTVSNAAPDISDPLRSLWLGGLRLAAGPPMFSSRPYRAELTPWRLPGQCELERLGDDLRRDYAVQVVLAMRTLAPEHLQFRVVRAGTGAVAQDLHRWPTPLHAFLTTMPWIPVARPGGPLRYVTAGKAWHFRGDEERPPRFVDLIVPQVALALNEVTVLWLRMQAKLGVFNDDSDAGRAVGALTSAAAQGISDVRDVRAFRDAFRRLWTRAREHGQSVPATFVPVMVGGAVSVIGRATGLDGQAFFIDENDPVKRQLLDELGAPLFDFVSGDDGSAWTWVQTAAPGRLRRSSEEAVEVFVGGAQFNDAVETRLITEAIGPWIADFFVYVAEHKGGAFVQVTQNTLGKTRRAAMSLSVLLTEDVGISIGGERRPMPASLRGVVALRTSRGPVLIVQTKATELTLDMLASMAVHIASALGSRELANGLEASLLRLSNSHHDGDGEPPSDELMAAAVGVDVDDILKTRQLASGDLSSLLYFAVPLAACVGSGETLALLRELASTDDPSHDALRAAFESLASEHGSSPSQLEEQLALLNDLRDLKDVFHLSISVLNAAVERLGGTYKVVSNELLHREAWLRHLRLRQKDVVDQLRERSAGAFDRQVGLDSYVAARDGVLEVAADPGWFTAYDELPEAVMDERISGWVQQQTPSDPVAAPLDESLSECRSSNGARLREFWEKFGEILSAWVRLQGDAVTADVRQAWTDPSLTRDVYAARAREHGWLDFRLLDESAIVQWLTLEGVWPADRVASTDLGAWGLSAASVSSSAERTQAEREEQKRRKTEITFAGQTYSGLEAGYVDLAAAVHAGLENAARLLDLKASHKTLQTLEDPTPSGTPGRGRGHGTGTPKIPEASMSDTQKKAIGLVGEVCARKWIALTHSIDVDESVWVSRYRDAVLITGGGSDLLGYDFVVATKSRTYYYEVKASSGDPRRFEMGPTEIGTALRYKADRDHRYRILYIAFATDPARTQATLLHNPFSTSGEGKLRPVGRGSVTYEFEVAQ